jgi:hypothetical protein
MVAEPEVVPVQPNELLTAVTVKVFVVGELGLIPPIFTVYGLDVTLLTDVVVEPSDHVKSHGPTPVRVTAKEDPCVKQTVSVPLTVAVGIGMRKTASFTVSPKQPDAFSSTTIRVSVPAVELQFTVIAFVELPLACVPPETTQW